MNTKIFNETLPERTAKLVEHLQHIQPRFLNKFYLSGGTGLSLQIGHRESEDLDFFSENSFSAQTIEQELVTLGPLSNTERSEGTLNTFLNRVKLQFLEYPYPLLENITNWNGILLSSVLDIACTKLQTISMRGSKKDFIDLFFILDRYSLDEIFLNLEKKYSQTNYNQAHILKSLVYFSDADEQPMPRMHKQVSWDEIKQKILQSVKSSSLLE